MQLQRPIQRLPKHPTKMHLHPLPRHPLHRPQPPARRHPIQIDRHGHEEIRQHAMHMHRNFPTRMPRNPKHADHRVTGLRVTTTWRRVWVRTIASAAVIRPRTIVIQGHDLHVQGVRWGARVGRVRDHRVQRVLLAWVLTSSSFVCTCCLMATTTTVAVTQERRDPLFTEL